MLHCAHRERYQAHWEREDFSPVRLCLRSAGLLWQGSGRVAETERISLCSTAWNSQMRHLIKKQVWLLFWPLLGFQMSPLHVPVSSSLLIRTPVIQNQGHPYGLMWYCGVVRSVCLVLVLNSWHTAPKTLGISWLIRVRGASSVIHNKPLSTTPVFIQLSDSRRKGLVTRWTNTGIRIIPRQPPGWAGLQLNPIRLFICCSSTFLVTAS